MREICTDALDALTMQQSGGALHFGAQRMSSGQLGLCFAHEKLLHPAGCRRAGGRARTGGGAGVGALDLLTVSPSPPQLGDSMPYTAKSPHAAV